VLAESIDIHDEASLASLQRIPLFSTSLQSSLQTSSVMMTSNTVVSICTITTPQSQMDNALICTGDHLFYLKMIPLSLQVRFCFCLAATNYMILFADIFDG
jgi:hypothetical protein